jgi:hypothetical protein
MITGLFLVISIERFKTNEYETIAKNEIISFGAQGLSKEDLKDVLSEYINQSIQNSKEEIKLNQRLKFLGLLLLILTSWIYGGLLSLGYQLRKRASDIPNGL